MNKKPFLYAAKNLFLLPLIFAVIYAIIFYVRKDTAVQEFNTLISQVPSLVRFGSSVISVVNDYFAKFGALAGLVFALIQMILASVIYLVMKVVRLAKCKLSVPLALFIALLPLIFFGHNMVFVSNRFTALSGGIIQFAGYPLWYTSLIIGALLIFILLYGFLKKVKGDKVLMIGFMVGASMMLSGCDILHWFTFTSCSYSSDDVHCYQEVAVSSGDADECDMIPQKEGYTSSNPPQDKCHLMIAENTGDPTACNDMKGGFGSYTRDECLENVFANGSPDDCAGLPNEKECRDMYAQNGGVAVEEEEDQEEEKEEDDDKDEKPECGKKDFYCLSTTTLQICTDEGKVAYETCINGCSDKQCLSEEEKDEEEAEEDKEKEEEEEGECKTGVNICLSDVTIKTCLAGKKALEQCSFGCKNGACLTEEKKKCTGWQRLNPFCSEADDDIEDKEEADISTIKDAVTGHYMDALQAAIDSETDPSKIRGLEAYQSFLNKAGEQMESAQTTLDDLNAIKRIFLDSYDPSMDIQNMDVSKILKPGIFDRIGTAIFGGPKTEAGIEMAEAADGLSVYGQMLERQAEIDFLKQDRMQRLGSVLADKAKGEMVDELKDKVSDIAGGIAGEAMIAVTVVDYALTSFQDEAKHQLFVGLSRAYNRRRAALQSENPDMSEADIHKRATEQVKDDPYRDAKGLTFIKYGNLIENADCQASTGNQLCIDNRVFWTAMGQTYEHTHEKELRKRARDKLNREFEAEGY